MFNYCYVSESCKRLAVVSMHFSDTRDCILRPAHCSLSLNALTFTRNWSLPQWIQSQLP